VSGGEAGAEAGRLVIMAGGDAARFETWRGLLEVMGRPTMWARSGPVGSTD
jgi:3-hydroxyisobutyrate dehydrogenase-like beta-hydroxyacid dehydrogenase